MSHPRKVWHGVTNGLVEAADLGKGKNMFFLAHDRELAESYADETGVIFEIKDLSVNPVILDTPEAFERVWVECGAKGAPGNFHPVKTGLLAEWGRSRGHDAIVIPSSAFEGELGYALVAGTVGEPQTILLDVAKMKVSRALKVSSEAPRP